MERIAGDEDMVNNLPPRIIQSGFSLIELMVAVAIMGIVMAVAVPSLKDYIGNERLRGAGSDLIVSALFSRSEALKRNSVIFLKPSNSASGYESGWCVMIADTACDPLDPSNDVMKIMPANANVDFGTTAVTFNTSGRVAAQVNIAVSDPSGGVAPRCVTIDVTGNATQKRSATCP